MGSVSPVWGVVRLALSVIGLAAAGQALAAPCPDFTGRFHLSGEAQVVDVVLAALGSARDASKRSAIGLEGAASGVLAVTLRGGLTNDWPALPDVRLRQGSDFSCDGGGLSFVSKREFDRWRAEDGTWYRGTATVSLARVADGGLQVQVQFRGSQRVTVYAYDSATLSVPKPGSSRRFHETLYWPAWSVDDDRVRRPPAEEPPAVRSLRKSLDRAVLLNVQMGTPRQVAGGMLVSFDALNSKDVVAFEDRLRAAAIRYESRVAPIWSNGKFYMEFLIDESGGDKPSIPSPLRVEHELRKYGPPLADLVAVKWEGGAYVATMRLVRPHSAKSLVARLEAHAALFGSVALQESPSPAAGGSSDTIRVRLTIH